MASGDILAAYAASSTVACTLTSLASHSANGWESSAVTTTVNKPLDVHVMVRTKLHSAGTIGSDKAVYVYLFGSEDGTNYPSAGTALLTGGNASVANTTEGPILAAVISASVSNTVYNSLPFSVAQAFGGYVPRKWGIVVRNFTGVSLSSTAGDHVVSYTEIYQTVTP